MFKGAQYLDMGLYIFSYMLWVEVFLTMAEEGTGQSSVVLLSLMFF